MPAARRAFFKLKLFKIGWKWFKLGFRPCEVGSGCPAAAGLGPEWAACARRSWRSDAAPGGGFKLPAAARPGPAGPGRPGHRHGGAGSPRRSPGRASRLRLGDAAWPARWHFERLGGAMQLRKMLSFGHWRAQSQWR
jgi:hypothetical protein